MAKSKNMSYNEAYAALEKILAELESDDLNVDFMAENAKKAAALVQYCKEKLRGVESELEEIINPPSD